jgi:hypothetical protein
MKKIYALFAAFLLSSAALAQLPPNGGFEQWTTNPQGIEVPNGWITATFDATNTPITNDGVSKSTVRKSGAYSAKVEVKENGGYSIAFTQFTYNGTPDSIIWWGKRFSIGASDTTIVEMLGITNGSPVSGFNLSYFGVDADFIRLAVPVRNSNGQKAAVDTIQLAFAHGFIDQPNSDVGDYVLIDDVAVKNSAGLMSSMVNVLEGSVFPAPASEVVNVRFDARAGEGTVTIYDMNGRAVQTRELNGVAAGDRTETLNVTELPAGTYLLQVKQGAYDLTRQFSVVR